MAVPVGIELASLSIDPSFLALIPKSTAAEMMVLPLAVDADAVVVAFAEGFGRQVLQDLSFFLGKKVRVETFPGEVLASAIQKFYGITDIEARRNTVSGSSEFLSIKEEEKRIDASS